jgi:translation elongation factor EF-1alpha
VTARLLALLSKDMGTVVLGKIESGTIKLNDKLVVMPNKAKVEVTNIYCEDEETDSAICGENVKLKLRGIEDTVGCWSFNRLETNGSWKKFFRQRKSQVVSFSAT